MRFQKDDNKLMWERYTGEIPGLKRFNAQSFDTDDDPLVPEINASSYFDDDEEAPVVLEFEPEGSLVPDLDDSDGFGDMVEIDEEPEDEIDEVLYSDIKKLADYSNRLLKDVDHGDLETWMIAKLIKASEYVSDVWHRVDAKADFANKGVEIDDL